MLKAIVQSLSKRIRNSMVSLTNDDDDDDDDDDGDDDERGEQSSTHTTHKQNIASINIIR